MQLLISDVAAMLGKSTDTIRRWCSIGRLPFSRTPGGVRIFRRDDVLKLASDLGLRVLERSQDVNQLSNGHEV